MTKSIQLGMAWCGGIFVAVFFSGLVIAGFFPPIPPSHSAAEVAHQYQQHADAIRSGCVIMMIAVGFSLPFSAVISTQLARIEGRWTPLCYTQLAAGAVGMVAATFPLFFFIAASFRPGRNPEVTQALNDIGWIPFIINWPPAVCQAGAVAVAVLADRRPDPVYPRWIGYFMLWACIAFTGSSLLPFFKHGPFAWNGLFSFWLAATFFGSFFLVMTWGTIRAVKRQFAPQSTDAETALQPA
jgi:hypothetical protein